MTQDNYGFMRVAAAVPRAHVGDVQANVEEIHRLIVQADDAGCALVVFPECTLSGYTVNDLFHQDALLRAVDKGVAWLCEKMRDLRVVACVGAPVRIGNQLYNCGLVLQGGELLGIVPKTYLPGYSEYYEQRWFAPGTRLQQSEVMYNGAVVPCGVDLLFRSAEDPVRTFAVEMCEDVWAPIPPSGRHALAGATVILNLSASTALVAKSAYRRGLVCQQSGRCIAGYVMASSGPHESTTDVVFSGHALIAENGVLLTDSPRFQREAHMCIADIDVARLAHDRRQTTSFGAAMDAEAPVRRYVPWKYDVTRWQVPVRRPLPRMPFVPHDAAQREERCADIFAIQTAGLARRIEHTRTEKMVIGLSGGLDSTLAALVCVHACELLKIPLSHIDALTMPGFGTSKRTLTNVKTLCKELGITLEEIDIKDMCTQHFSLIGHDPKKHDVVYENVQARVRTQILMDRANQRYGIVVGTGDLSEIALGWSTYNADHISMYNVNCGVPKTLVRYVMSYVADTHVNAATRTVVEDILSTPVSPELLPTDPQGRMTQKTEETIGPYELHDFFLYHMIRCGASPRKMRFLAEQAFEDSYTREEIAQWLRVFIRRFFASQFKRSCVPDGPKVGTVALSPRGDWRMPSDASPAAWLAEVDAEA